MDETQRRLDKPSGRVYAEIGRRLREKRQRAGRTQAELARALEVRPATIARYERGARRIPIPALQRLADALRTPLDRLLVAGDPAPADDIRDQLTATQESLLRATRALEDLRGRIDRLASVGMASTVTEDDRRELEQYLEELAVVPEGSPASLPSPHEAPDKTRPTYRLVRWESPLPFDRRRGPTRDQQARFYAATGISPTLKLLFVAKDHPDARAAGIVAGDVVFFDPNLRPDGGDWVVVRATGGVFGIRPYRGTINELKWDPVPQTSPGDTPEEDHQHWMAWAARPLYLGKIVAVCRSTPRDRGGHRA